MTHLEKAIADIEAFIRCEPGEPAAISQTGEPYRAMVFSVPDLHRNGAHSDPEFLDPEFLASCAFVEATRRYAHDVMTASGMEDFSSLTLYWRIRPEMETNQDHVFVDESFELDKPAPCYGARPLLRFYARFLISAKPVLVQ